MSTVSAVPAVDSSPIRIVNRLLGILFGARTDCHLHVWGRSPSGFGATDFDIGVDKRHPTARVGQTLGTALRDGNWSLHVTAAMGHKRPLGPGHPPVSRLAALPVRFHVPLAYRNPRNPASKYGRKPAEDLERRAAVIEELAGFALSPTTVVWGGGLDSGGHQIAALYALDEPVAVGTRDEEAEVMATLRSLAESLGATVPEDDERLKAWLLPVPGSLVREDPRGRSRAEVMEMDVTRTYSFKQLEDAIGGKKKRAAKK